MRVRKHTTKHVSCREAGTDCDFETTSENEDVVADVVQIHSRPTHDESVSEDDVRSMLNEARTGRR